MSGMAHILTIDLKWEGSEGDDSEKEDDKEIMRRRKEGERGIGEVWEKVICFIYVYIHVHSQQVSCPLV